jgi:maltooligosyltrehalose trehalohydrolase
VSFEELKLAAALVLLSPYQPMLFMGEEYAEMSRFQFFVSHSDPELIEAVRRGRKEEFARFNWSEEPPDPQAEATFEKCKLDHRLKASGHHRMLREFYKQLIDLRKSEPSLAFPDRGRSDVTAWDAERVMAVHTWSQTTALVTLFHFGAEAATVDLSWPTGTWHKVLSSADRDWKGSGIAPADCIESRGAITTELAARSATVYRKSS